MDTCFATTTSSLAATDAYVIDSRRTEATFTCALHRLAPPQASPRPTADATRPSRPTPVWMSVTSPSPGRRHGGRDACGGWPSGR
eukprot:13077063-Heterocapsa_arctica.AAC.1